MGLVRFRSIVRTCAKFGALDIDTYPVDHLAILKKCRRFKLPLVVCRSKSGGAHLFLFMQDWISATDMRDHLMEFAAVLGYGAVRCSQNKTRFLPSVVMSATSLICRTSRQITHYVMR